MSQYTETSLWEAFAGGEGWADSADLTGVETVADWEARTEEFYTDIVGPAYGYGDIEFGKRFEGYLPVPTLSGFEQAEREFRQAVGDPFSQETWDQNPLNWRNLSRYTELEAQQIAEDIFYGEGDKVGGTVGSAYNIAMERARETHEGGVLSLREGLDTESIVSAKGLASGTSGAIIRSGIAAAKSEDILSEAVRSVKKLAGTHIESKATTEFEFTGDIDSALTDYLDAIDRERGAWYDQLQTSVMDIVRLDIEPAYLGETEEALVEIHAAIEEGITGVDPGGVKTFDEFSQGKCMLEPGSTTVVPEYGDNISCEDSGGEWIEGGIWSEGLSWSEEDAETAGSWLEHSGAPCGVGELRDEEGKCAPVEGFLYDDFGILCTNEAHIDLCGECCGSTDCGERSNSDNCFYQEGFTPDRDCAGVIGGTTEVDDCGVCGGDNSTCLPYDEDPSVHIVDTPPDENWQQQNWQLEPFQSLGDYLDEHGWWSTPSYATDFSAYMLEGVWKCQEQGGQWNNDIITCEFPESEQWNGD